MLHNRANYLKKKVLEDISPEEVRWKLYEAARINQFQQAVG